MIDARQYAVLIRDKGTGVWQNETAKVKRVEFEGASGIVEFTRSSKLYTYRTENVRVVGVSVRHRLTEAERAEIDGAVWSSVEETCVFRSDVGSWVHLFRSSDEGQRFSVRPEHSVRLVVSDGVVGYPAEVLAGWRRLVSQLPGDDPIQKPFSSLEFIHPESALSRLLRRGDAQMASPAETMLVLPFGSNLSQRSAVKKALRSHISVIDGPPGTGKTQTILNIVANLVLRGSTVAIVSSNNSAVDNVAEKLAREGVGFIAAELGRSDKRTEFFAAQSDRADQVRAFVDGPDAEPVEREVVSRLDSMIERSQERELTMSLARHELDALGLESKHFEKSLGRVGLPDLDDLPLLRKSADTILDYLATTGIRGESPPRGLGRLVTRVTDYFRFGKTAGLDPTVTETILALQRAFYQRRSEELNKTIEDCERQLEGERFADRLSEHRALSWQVLREDLRRRYRSLDVHAYSAAHYRQQIGGFLRDYPVILSTCHSLRASIGSEALLDYLIVDEASQVDLLAAAPALACAKNLIVVGDLKQLPHIVAKHLQESPRDERLGAFDYHEHSLLSSVIEQYGAELPRTLLREHYRCHPAIIGFSNQKFYDGGLVPYTSSGVEENPLVLVRAPEGNHMRVHRDKARSNQREIDIIINEVIPRVCAEFDPESIGVTTPYRRQADKASAQIMGEIAADTVHKFQGREKAAVVLSTVIDDSWNGRNGVFFVDDPKLVNVAVSRAMKRFVLVTNNELLPTSRNLRDLIGYIEYHNPDEPRIESETVSVFDLLYRRYSERLRPLSKRLREERDYKSEDIIWTVLHDILREERYEGFSVVPQVLLANMFPDVTTLTDRQQSYMRHRASVDFAVYNRVTRRLGFAIEVDGFAFHENNPHQRERDEVKNAIFAAFGIPLLRLATTESGEERRIRDQLDAMLVPRAR
ncbi:AAA domain-containing protein [Leifsonia sp. TF02-11]|uniref:AAA domain-containing protein n=1 Tax=Leifsonia sp. TF02-11 TaxID=2815212 RepID=UPI001AA0F9B5|nr:AAA domain-containing protein [Leifsonia sp. TF02-11]MBO1737195.1 AAA family ATPase [Leifsonia sp. TF02-11]